MNEQVGPAARWTPSSWSLAVALAARQASRRYYVLGNAAALAALAGRARRLRRWASLVFALCRRSGRELLAVRAESRIELRKVFWPTRQETWHDHAGRVRRRRGHAGIFFWVLDLLLGLGDASSLTGQGG